jgi:hypothetical protein
MAEFGDVVEKIWLKEFLGAKWWFLGLWGLIWGNTGAQMNWKCNLDQIEGLIYKFGGLGAFLELFFKSQGLLWKNLDRGLIFGKWRGYFAKWWKFQVFGIYFKTKKFVDRVHDP